MKKIICLCLCLLMLIPSLASCSRPPEYAEIEGRLKELIEASHEINGIFWGEGLETYERIYDPISTLQVHTVTDPEDPDTVLSRTYYYELRDEEYGRVIAFRSSYADPYSYVQILTERDSTREPYYVSDSGKSFCYLLEDYVEPEYEFFYEASDPSDYDFVRLDSPYQSIHAIKTAAERVYSPEFLNSRYDTLFVGTAGLTDSVVGLSARYMEYTDDEGATYLMQSNTFEALISERRVYDFSTARIIKPSNKKYVTVEMDSYLESKPDQILRVRVSMQLVDGVWYLDSPTY